jgi:ubiquinone/menaquinone biosynthesis C-methylase UbiE
MIEQARKKYPYLSFYEANALNLHFENEFDAVFSNAVLYWIKPPERVLEGIYKALKKGGRFVAEFGGKGNVQMIVNAALEMFRKEGIKNQADRIPWYFPSIGEYASMMEKSWFSGNSGVPF